MSTKSKWVNGILTFFNDATFETVSPLAPVVLYDDFLAAAIQTSAAGVPGWTVRDTAGGTPAILANTSCGVYNLPLTNANEKQESGIYLGDALNFNLDKKVIFEARVAVLTLPTDQAELYFGLANAYVEGPIAEADAGPTIHAFFCFDGSGACKIFTDDTSTDTDATATGITVTAGATEWHIYRIDCTNPADVRFFIDGVSVGTGTTHNISNGTGVVTQPFFMAHKETGAGVGTMYVDYVRVWQER